MKLKKTIAALLAAVVATGAGAMAVACSDSDEDAKPPIVNTDEYTVTYDSDGGSAVASETVDSGSKLTKPADPAKDGYDFDGWYTASGAKWNFDTDTVTANITLTAHWTEQAAEPTDLALLDFTDVEGGLSVKAKLGATLPDAVVLPSSKDNKAVVEIAANGFEGAQIKSIRIPSSVKSIGARAFRNASKLAAVTGAANVESIESNAFYGTAWAKSLGAGLNYLGKTLYTYAGTMPANTAVEVQAGTLGIAAGALQNQKNVTALTLPAGLKNIGSYAFGGETNGAGITALVIPDSVTNIGDNAFRNAKSLATLTIGKGVTSIGNNAFNGAPVTALTYNANAEVADNAFGEVTADSTVTFGDEVTAIPVAVVSKLNLTSVTLGEAISAIPDNAFDGKAKLAGITVRGEITSIGANAFRGTGFTSFTIGATVESIGAGAFANCASLATVNYNAEDATGAPNTSLAFAGCSTLKTVTIGSTATKIPAYMFKNCAALDTLTIGANITEIGAEAFYGTAIAEVTIPAKVVKIGSAAFGSCASLATVNYNASSAVYDGTTTVFANASTVTVGGGVTVIPAYFAKGNTVLASITLPAGVSVGDYAFQDCTALGEIGGYDTVGNVGASAFDGSKYYIDNMRDGLIVQGSIITGYRGEMPASFTLNAAAIPAGKTVTGIAANAFNGKTNLVAIELPASVTTIGANAFEGTSLAGAVDLSSVTEIGESAFKNLSKITAITISENVTNIGASAFEGCSGAAMTLKATKLTALGERAFYGCIKLTAVEVDGVATVPRSAFNRAALTSVKLGSTVETVGDYWASFASVTEFTAPSLKHVGKNGLVNLKAAFDFSNLVTVGEGALVGVGGANTAIVFGENLESLGAKMLCTVDSSNKITGNTAITSITIKSAKLTAIPMYCFAGCSALTTFTVEKNNITEIGAYAFHTSGVSSFDFSKVTEIGDYAFCSSKLTSVQFGSELASLGQYSFNNISTLTGTLVVGQKLKIVPTNAFSRTALTDITIKGNVKTLDTAAFMSVKFHSVVVEEGVTDILDAALQVGYSLSTNAVVTLPSTVTNITAGALNGVIRVNIVGGFADATLGKTAFNSGAVIIVPAANLETYKTSAKWTAYAAQIYADSAIDENGVIVENGTLVKYASTSESIEIPASVNAIAGGVLEKVNTITVAEANTALKAVNNVVYSKDGATLVCYPASLADESFEVPAEVTAISAGALRNGKFKSITLKSQTPPTLGENAFEGCVFTLINVPAGKSADYKAAAGWSAYEGLILAEGEELPPFQVVNGRLIKYNGHEANVVIPDNVTQIATGAFEGCDFITELTIGKGVIKVERTSSFPVSYGTNGLTGVVTLNFNSTAFLDLSSDNPFGSTRLSALKTINVGEGVTRLPNYVFKGASATTINFPSTLKTIGQNALTDMTSLTTINWGTSEVTTIEANAFRASSSSAPFNMTEISIPASVTSIGDAAFYFQSKLTKITFNGIPATFGSNPFGGCNAVNTIAYADGLTTVIPVATLCIPDLTKITSIVLPASITDIPASAFSGCTNLVYEFAFPAGIKTIGDNAFNNCKKVTGVITSFPATLTSIGNNAFKSCGITGDWGAISLTKAFIDACGASPFDGCLGITGKPTLPAGYTVCPAFFRGTGITDIDLTGMTGIADNAFYGCTGITSLDLSKITTFGASAFRSSGLTSVDLESAVTIGDYAFGFSKSLHTVSIGANVTTIGSRAFSNGDTAMVVTIKATTPPTVTNNSFGSKTAFVGKICVPAASVEAYKTAGIWADNYADKIEAIPAATPAVAASVDAPEALPARKEQ